MKISKFFTLNEATRSDTARLKNIPNIPSDTDLATIGRTAMKMDRVREILDGPVYVSSWYRNEEVNRLVGGVPNSQHQKGEAVDFSCPTAGRLRDQYDILRAHKDTLEYDQLILEPNWLHISFNTSRESRDKAPRKQDLDLSNGRQ